MNVYKSHTVRMGGEKKRKVEWKVEGGVVKRGEGGEGDAVGERKVWAGGS